MKRFFTLIFFIPFVVMMVAGCVKKPAADAVPLILPYGNFKGLFSKIHYSAKTKKYDTVRANLTLLLNPTILAFVVGGDTSTVHAGSRGNYSLDAFSIAFDDQTLRTADGIKIHLTGAYSYAFNGDVLQMQYLQGDSLKFAYNMKVQ